MRGATRSGYQPYVPDRSASQTPTHVQEQIRKPTNSRVSLHGARMVGTAYRDEAVAGALAGLLVGGMLLYGGLKIGERLGLIDLEPKPPVVQPGPGFATGGGRQVQPNPPDMEEGSLGVRGASAESDLMARMQAAQQARSSTSRGIVM